MISVVMPVYNAEKFLRDAIESILNQTFEDFEFIILNDGSTDSSLEIIESYKDNRIKLIDNKNNRGYCLILNEGISVAAGLYIARMDSDDISLPERFNKQLAFLEANSDFGLCSTNACAVNEKDILLNRKMYPKDSTPVEWQLLWTNPIAHPTVMFRKSIVDQYNLLYDSDMYPAEDYALWCKMAAITKLYRLDEVLLKYRVLGGSAYHSNFQKAVDKSIEISETYVRSFIQKRKIPWFHFEIVRFSFSGKINFDNFNLKQIKEWNNELTNILNEKYTWTIAELNLVKVNEYQRYISLIKRIKLSPWEKALLLLKNIPMNILFRTFIIRIIINR